MECSTIEAFLPSPPSKIAFIGSGPLPLTSLCFLDRYPNAQVHNVDRDASALQVSESLCKRLGYGKRMSFACEDITEVSSNAEWQSCQVVFLAALVGTDTYTKLNILKSMVKKLVPGTLVVARSAQGMRSVLYPVCSHRLPAQSCQTVVINENTDTGTVRRTPIHRSRDSCRSTSVD